MKTYININKLLKWKTKELDTNSFHYYVKRKMMTHNGITRYWSTGEFVYLIYKKEVSKEEYWKAYDKVFDDAWIS